VHRGLDLAAVEGVVEMRNGTIESFACDPTHLALGSVARVEHVAHDSSQTADGVGSNVTAGEVTIGPGHAKGRFVRWSAWVATLRPARRVAQRTVYP
jgi:hypothetical protein